MDIQIRQAEAGDTAVVSAILTEAAVWLETRGMTLWRTDDLTPEQIFKDVSTGLYFLAEHAGRAAGTIKFQLSDLMFWPDVAQDEAAFIHRVAVRREFAGGTASFAMLSWALRRTQALNRRFLRLDCDTARPRLRAVYERFGFRHHSDRQVGPYAVARYELEVVERGGHRENVRQRKVVKRIVERATLRPATSDDVGFLTRTFLVSMRDSIEAARGVWDEARERAQFEHQLDLEHTKVICVGDSGVGFVTVIPRSAEIELHTLCVVPERQSQGIGSLVTRQIGESDYAAGIPIAASVLKTNMRATRFYKRLGFVRTGESRHHLRLVLSPKQMS